jgi:hypothetical protein
LRSTCRPIPDLRDTNGSRYEAVFDGGGAGFILKKLRKPTHGGGLRHGASPSVPAMTVTLPSTFKRSVTKIVNIGLVGDSTLCLELK